MAQRKVIDVGPEAERLAMIFHQQGMELAIELNTFGGETTMAWDEVPWPEKNLLISTMQRMIDVGVIRVGSPEVD